ncbi:MAG TPA: hypothetical protein VMZ29_00215 [Candidatus Bathyarchaeia archaeon]|nr:hypothetical protein [Candidatus Bathyarchaeia archaeon]
MSLDHLFFTYGKEKIQTWVTTLNAFRLCSCYPYPADNKPERFIAKISFKKELELQEILEKLDFVIDNKKPKISQYHDYNEHHSAGWILLNGDSCYLDVNKMLKTVIFEVSGTYDDPFKLNELVFRRAVRIEEYLVDLGLVFNNPPQDDRYCIAPKFYPEIWCK